MSRTVHALTLGIAFAAAATATAGVMVTDRQSFELPMNPSGVVVVENTYGNVQVSVSGEAKLSVTADRVIRAVDGAALAEARQAVQRVAEGTEKTRVLRTLHSGAASPRWSAQVNYTIVVPRNAHVKVVSQNGGIRIDGVAGMVTAKNVMGAIVINDSHGQVTVESVNGDVSLIAPSGVHANALLTSINGSIVVRAPANARFGWEAETMMGDAQTAFAVSGAQFISPTRFRGSINSPTDVKVVTQTFGGDIILIPIGEERPRRSVRTLAKNLVVPAQDRSGVGPMLPSTHRGHVHVPMVPSAYSYETSIGNVRIDEIRGAARIVTGAGEVNLGSVFGHADVYSNGGPLTLGDITGVLMARTAAGNIAVQRAREGGTIETGGGTIQLQYAGGPVQLSSGGGDIVVHQAVGRVNAETRSGDISITLDRSLKSERVSARTAKGNIVLTLPRGFAADIDAVVITSDPSVNSIRSDFPGLSIQREQVGGKTRIRATGKMNGGGQKLDLQAQDGGIQILLDGPRVSPMLPH
ncbi:MAG TPA: hypothetical protein VFT12_05400 [Thermoanaerobaculia bacterium]|nr:hypothetical protein [Thermoanaerobaculia bacterium]